MHQKLFRNVILNNLCKIDFNDYYEPEVEIEISLMCGVCSHVNPWVYILNFTGYGEGRGRRIIK